MYFCCKISQSFTIPSFITSTNRIFNQAAVNYTFTPTNSGAKANKFHKTMNHKAIIPANNISNILIRLPLPARKYGTPRRGMNNFFLLHLRPFPTRFHIHPTKSLQMEKKRFPKPPKKTTTRPCRKHIYLMSICT